MNRVHFHSFYIDKNDFGEVSQRSGFHGGWESKIAWYLHYSFVYSDALDLWMVVRKDRVIRSLKATASRQCWSEWRWMHKCPEKAKVFTKGIVKIGIKASHRVLGVWRLIVSYVILNFIAIVCVADGLIHLRCSKSFVPIQPSIHLVRTFYTTFQSNELARRSHSQENWVKVKLKAPNLLEEAT